MSLWVMLVLVLAAGGIGGLVNAYLTDNGFVWPKKESAGAIVVTRPGFLGSMFVGAVAAAASWGLYGPFAATPLVGGQAAIDDSIGLTLSALVGALLVGIGGGRWLTDHADKSMLKATAVQAAAGGADAAKSAAIVASSPARALEIARTL